MSTHDFEVRLSDASAQKLLVYSAESNKLVNGRPTADVLSRVYLYLPPISFELRNGEVDVTVLEDGQIVLPMTWDVDRARELVFDEARRLRLLDETSKVSQVLPMSAKRLIIETAPTYSGPPIRFFDAENVKFNKNRGILLGKSSREGAERFARDVKAGNAILSVSFVFEGYSYQENRIILSVEDLAKTSRYRKLVGEGKERFLGRRQVMDVSVEAATIAGYSSIREYDDPDLNRVAEKLLALLERRDVQLAEGWTTVNEIVKDWGYTPADLAADVRRKLASSGTSKHSEEFKKKVDKYEREKGGGGATVDFIGFLNVTGGGGGEEERKYSEDVLRSVLTENGFNYSEEGEKTIPKSVTLYSSNFGKVSGSTKFDLSSRLNLKSDGIARFDLDPRNSVIEATRSTTVDERIAALSARSIPTGTVLPYAGGEVPSGWLLCDGREVKAVDHPALYAVIKNGFGGKGNESFRLPDLRGRFPVGAGKGDGLEFRELGKAYGREAYVLSPNQLPAHAHAVDLKTNAAGAHRHDIENHGDIGGDTGNGDGNFEVGKRERHRNLPHVRLTEAGEHQHTVQGNTAETGKGEPYPVLPPSVGVQFIIKG